MIIGICGTICSGKSTAVEYLRDQYKFKVLSTGLEVTIEAKARDIEVNRLNLQNLGKKLEFEFPGYWPRGLMARMEDSVDYVVDILRYPHRVAIFREMENFILLGITANTTIREQRFFLRNRIGDGDFKTADKNDRYILQRTQECLQMSDSIFYNNGDINELHNWLDSHNGGKNVDWSCR